MRIKRIDEKHRGYQLCNVLSFCPQEYGVQVHRIMIKTHCVESSASQGASMFIQGAFYLDSLSFRSYFEGLHIC